MGEYRLFIKPSAVREIEGLPKKDRLRVLRRIEGLGNDPRPPACEKLSGEEKYRVRQGRYRVIYSVDDTNRTVVVVKVGHRREVYR
ncbi:MAG TPA: type II toxin-antitoxin system RelE/ParE family toxin [Terriglobia bacterium]|nr:type II toxin-antitoxin system RelE/ParE family toxin [Terriglobia bacterium]